MKSFKKVLRLLLLIFLIILATVGIGISGGIPVSSSGRKESVEVKIELVETDEEEADLPEPGVKQ